uniref:Uncharacterized protein n=1 Tax=Tanacetum cinerariifolium TaxID=118510 RepID=A0A6L2K8H3_TANCI|nr:hypothetical protein [Tanacetum cinerariifolium]
MVLQLTDITSEITDKELLEFTSEYYIPLALHPVVPAVNASIAEFPVGKRGTLEKPKLVTEGVRPLRDGEEPLLEATAGRTIELVLEQLEDENTAVLEPTPLCSVSDANVDPPERNVTCADYSEAAGSSYKIYLVQESDSNKPVLHLIQVDASVFPIVVPWYLNKSLKKDPSPLPTEYNADVYDYLAANSAPFKKFSEPFLCLIGISRYYTLDEGCYPTCWDDEDEGGCSLFMREVPLLELTKDRVVLLVGVYDRGNANVQGAGNDDVNEGPKKIKKKRKVTDGVGGSGYPPKKLREDYGTSDDAGVSVAGKSLVSLQGLLERSTLAMKVGVTAAAIIPFVTSFVITTAEHEGGRDGDSATGPIIRTCPAMERFVVLTDSSLYSGTNATDDEVTSIVRSPVNPSIFRDSASSTTAEADVAGPSQPVGTDHSAGRFYISQDMDAETLRQVYISKWNAMDYEQLLAEYSVGVTRQACFSAKVRMRLEHELRGRQKLEERCAQQVDRLKEKDTEIATLKA